MTASPQPGNQDERRCVCQHRYLEHYIPRDLSQPPGACDRLCQCTGFVDAAAAAGQAGAGEEADGRCTGDYGCRAGDPHWGACPWASGLDQPAPSAGQDTGQMRDEPEWVSAFFEWAKTDKSPGSYSAAFAAGWSAAQGPLRQLIAERDEARAQVQRAAEALREVHRPDGTTPLACDWCGEAWPCSPIRALDPT